jgi:hypothetical protein
MSSVAFRRIRKLSKSDFLLRHVCPSVCLFVRPHGTIRLPLDGVSLNLIFVYFSKICRENSSFLMSDKYSGYVT